ncbi:MAG: HlyD family efflux transporter periplasmic adaptor subunit [Aquidulcibacter sp.]|uniref:HlyD family efflux transporter periplasmic adaptor subunit n=1 Tax=Aquidulcibacter sp. TaxID=2052990 RepID=UPI0022C70B2F|nr:HlyD family efflux transporter periplasmic adaptor subunit [Aquidulcibacter sp.]
MNPKSPFREEALNNAGNRIEGKVILVTPISTTALLLLLALIFVSGGFFAVTATFSKKEVVRGWLAWSSGTVLLRAPANTVITVIAVEEGDWVQEGQMLAWADSTRQGGTAVSQSAQSNGSMIVAPVSGQVVSVETFKGQSIATDTVLFSIVPDGGRLIARLVVPTRAAGFIKKGQEVLVQVDAFPYQKFGALRARITRITGNTLTSEQQEASVAIQEPSYLVDAEFYSNFVFAYGDTITLQNGMYFTANIIIDHRNLLEWMFDPLFALSEGIEK